MSWEIRQGNALDLLREMPAGIVQTCVTSPPYWGLRDYGTAEWEGGDEGCDHRNETHIAEDHTSTLGVPAGGGARRIAEGNATRQVNGVYRDICGKCGAKRIDSQLGLEPTPDEYVQNLVNVFREVRRVLRDDGTVWLNLGDSYPGPPAGNTKPRSEIPNGRGLFDVHGGAGQETHFSGPRKGGGDKDWRGAGLKPKDLCGIPWRVAFALQADGWWLRSDIIWAKPNPMPESVTDRPTRSHEYIFLLSKSARYFYDADAVREQDGGRPSGNGFVREHRLTYQNEDGTGRGDEEQWEPGGGRNKRSVWHVATQPYSEAHFATFPPKLIEPCILAGSAPKACGECGAPWERVVERQVREGWTDHSQDSEIGMRQVKMGQVSWSAYEPPQTIGWQPSCSHLCRACKGEGHGKEMHGESWLCAACEGEGTLSGQSIVLDPFAGSGTTGMVALRHNRSFIGIELNCSYIEMARQRIISDAPLLNHGLEVLDAA